ncbi:MAG: RING-HC finger protein [Simkania negevensis]|nr:RING-HC finger protein [Simkania negevensis]
MAVQLGLLTGNACIGIFSYCLALRYTRMDSFFLNVQIGAWLASSLIKACQGKPQENSMKGKIVVWMPLLGLGSYYLYKSNLQKAFVTSCVAICLEVSQQFFTFLTKKPELGLGKEPPSTRETEQRHRLKSTKQRGTTEKKRDRRERKSECFLQDNPLSYAVTGSILSPPGSKGLVDALVLPWGYTDVVEFPGGTVIHFETEHIAYFTNDPRIQSLEKRFNVKFEFHLSAEKEVNLKGVVPDGTTHFQYISQAYFKPQQGRFYQPVTFQEQNEIIKAIEENALGTDGAAMQRKSLLLYGGFFYHSGLRNKDGNRGIAGIRIFLPPTHTTKTFLCFGRAKLINETARKFLSERLLENSNPITVQGLLDKGFTHYQWLPPGHVAIISMQNEMRDKGFGKYGVFFYHSETNPGYDCMLPVVDKQIADDILDHTYYLEATNNTAYKAVFTADECVSCESVPPAIQLTCGHLITCESCQSTWESQGKKTCMVCREKVTRESILVVGAKDSLALNNIRLPLAWINIHAITDQQFDLHQLYRDNTYRSESHNVTQSLIKHFSGSATLTTADRFVFIYPLSGKRLSWIYKNLPTIERLSAWSSNLRSLFKAGGFAFLDKDDHLKQVYAIVGENDDAPVTLSYSKRDVSHIEKGNIQKALEILHRQAKQPEDYEQWSSIQQEKWVREKNTFDGARITLGNLRPYTHFFQATADGFVYAGHKKDEYWTMNLDS